MKNILSLGTIKGAGRLYWRKGEMRVEIRIGDDYRLTSDNCNIVLEHKKVVERGKNIGKSYWVPESYHPNIEQACEALIDKRIKKSDAKTLKALSEQVEAAKKEILEAVRCSRS